MASTTGSTRSRPSEPLFLALDTRVTCPQCQARFSLQEGFARQSLEQLEQSSAGALEALRAGERAEAAKRASQLVEQREGLLREENAHLQQLLTQQREAHARALQSERAHAEQPLTQQLQLLRSQLAEKDSRLAGLAEREAGLLAREQQLEARVEQAAQAKARSLFAADRAALERQLDDKSRIVAELQSTELALRQERAQLQQRAAALELEVARRLDAERGELELRVRAQERERAELEKADLQKRLDDVNAQLAEAQRKGQQGSQQLQGEVLELTLESALERAFPLDAIEEVRKGVRGGDVIQRVLTRTGQSAGVLLWEAKRAKDWSAQWLGKLKEDMRGCGADLGVLVITGTALPREWESGQLFGLIEEVWVTTWGAALQLAVVLRANLLELHTQRLVSAGKGEKMEAVYDYLTSSQFAQKLKAVYGAFHRMRQELESEKSTTQQRWARREKQLQSGVAALVGVAGDIQGLSQQDLPLLEIEGEAEPEPATSAASGDTPQLGLRMGE